MGHSSFTLRSRPCRDLTTTAAQAAFDLKRCTVDVVTSGSTRNRAAWAISSGSPVGRRQLRAGDLHGFLREELPLARRVGPAGVEDVDANAMLEKLVGRGAGHLIEAGLGDVVGHRVGNAILPCGDEVITIAPPRPCLII